MADLATEQMLKQSVGAIVGTEKRFQEFLKEIPKEEAEAWMERLLQEEATASLDFRKQVTKAA